MDEYRLVCKIHEIRSYIASDWPSVEERRVLYDTLYNLEALLKGIKNEAEHKQKED